LQEVGRGDASTSRYFTRVRPHGSSEQQANHQISPKQPSKLLGEFGRLTCNQSGRLSLNHDFPQGEAARRLSYSGNRKPKYGNNR